MTKNPGPVVTLGETMALVRADEIGSLNQVSRMSLSIGGAESNMAIGLARLDVPVTWIGRVGNDSLGERITRELRAEGVTAQSITDPDAATGLMIKERRTADAIRVWYYRAGSAGSRLNPADIDEEMVARASVLHVTGITPGLSDDAAHAVLTAVAIARQHAVAVSFDVNHRSQVWRGRDAGATYRELAALSDIIFAGPDEARVLVDGDEDIDLAKALSALGPSEAVIKRGPLGALVWAAGKLYEQPALSITPVDSVGAGDAFVAGYLREYRMGTSIPERLQTATTTGAFACLGPGDWEASPKRQELQLLHATEPVQR